MCDVLQNGAQPDVKRVYQNADAFVDLPGNLFWEEILEAFPDCKVILSERDEDSWLQSWANQLKMLQSIRFQTILRAMLSQTGRKFDVIANSCVQASLGSTNPKSTCVFRKRYRMHNYRVKSIVPPAKLLVFNVKQGWKPLCDFLGCEVPGIVNRTFENRTQSNSIELNPWIEFDWVRQSNEIEHHTFSEFDFRTNRIQSNKSNSIEHN